MMLNTSLNTKTENIALNTLEAIIDEHTTMLYEFNSMDKEMAWDGFITIFKNDIDGHTKKNYDDKVPVQIKGHVDKKNMFINKQRISYRVDLEDLKIYFNDRGVIYFEVFVSEDGKKKEIFYSSLFPSKIKSYLEKAKKKNKKSINIPFAKMEKKPDKFYNVIKQFSNESRKQGFGCEQIVQNTIMLKDIKQIECLKASVVGATNEFDFVKRLGDGDVCFYATKPGSIFELPVEWEDGGTFFARKTVSNSISISNKLYYKQYDLEASSDGDITIIFSENLRINLKEKKFNFMPKSCVQKLSVDAQFLLSTLKNSEVFVNNIAIQYSNLNMPEKLKNELDYFVYLGETLEMIELNYNKPFVDILPEEIRQLSYLVDLRKGKHNKLLINKTYKYNWMIGHKYVPIIVSRHDDDEENDMFNAVYTERYQAFVTDEENNDYKVPLFAYVDREAISNLLYYDYEKLEHQIDIADVNKYTVNTLNLAAIRLIQAYDFTKDDRLLELAKNQLDKIEALEKEEDYYIINSLQIKIRQEKLTETDIEKLKNIKSDDLQIKCGINILLGQVGVAKGLLSEMDSSTQEAFSEFPIFTLYKILCEKCKL